MSEPQEPQNGADENTGADQNESSLDELFPDVELGEDDGSEGYQNHDELDHDLDELMGRARDEAPAAPTEPEAAGDRELEEAAGGDEDVLADETEVDLDAALGMTDEAAPAADEAPAGAAAPAADGEIPVLRDKVDPTRMPHAGLSDDDLTKLADLLTADLEARLDTIIVEAVDHEMDRVSTALKNAIHRQLKGRLPDIIAEFVSETRRL